MKRPKLKPKSAKPVNSRNKPFHETMWGTLAMLIGSYADARVDNSWAGGGDPADMEVLATREALARHELNAHIIKMQRETGAPP
jgi:hypothetical protein